MKSGGSEGGEPAKSSGNRNADIKLSLNEITTKRATIQSSQSPRKTGGAAASNNVSPKRAITASNTQHADGGKAGGKNKNGGKTKKS